MSLFTDGPIIGPSDLENIESAILNVANIEGIDLSAKIGLAQNDIANQVILFLLRRLRLRDLQWTQRRRVGVSDVVVTGPLREWHAHKTLALVYRDAYNNQLNDRYQGKWVEYQQLANDSSQTYFQIGVGLAANPIAKATTPTLSAIAGSGAWGTFFVAVTWVNQAGEEGAPSDVSEYTTSDGQQLIVAAVNAPENAVGWNVYAGMSPASVGLQNSTPLAVSNTWTMSASMQAGVPPSEGQAPAWYVVDQHIMERG